VSFAPARQAHTNILISSYSLPPFLLNSLLFSYEVLTPAALSFFVSYADGAVESLWSIDQYFEFVLVLMLSTGLSFQVGTGRGVNAAMRVMMV
jgi:Sec-independent protein secretion pathway component TatC